MVGGAAAQVDSRSFGLRVAVGSQAYIVNVAPLVTVQNIDSCLSAAPGLPPLPAVSITAGVVTTNNLLRLVVYAPVAVATMGAYAFPNSDNGIHARLKYCRDLIQDVTASPDGQRL